MPLDYIRHEKLDLRRSPDFNEAWLQERIGEDPSILGLGDVRVLDRERSLPGGGRLDMLLFDEDNNRRYEVELMLGATDPSHIIRCIEYWDLERRRYPGYDHVAVLVAEDITSRFLNVLALLTGSIPMVAIQLDALSANGNVLLNFVRVLDQAELRVDDSDEDSGGGGVDRAYWEKKAGSDLMGMCDGVLAFINGAGTQAYELNYLRRYIGLRVASGSVNNFIYLTPKRTKGLVHLGFRNRDSAEWAGRFEALGVPVRAPRKARFRLSLTPKEFEANREAIQEAVVSTVAQVEG